MKTEKIRNFFIKLQNLPETNKKIILWAIVIVMGGVMGYFWVQSSANRLSELGEGANNQEAQITDIKLPVMPTEGLQIIGDQMNKASILLTTTPSNQ
jgi:hypothetical protein